MSTQRRPKIFSVTFTECHPHDVFDGASEMFTIKPGTPPIKLCAAD